MQEIPVSSSLIARAAYDAEAQELEIVFQKTGARWRYGSGARPFTQEDADAFAGAASKGQHFLAEIRGQWPERRG